MTVAGDFLPLLRANSLDSFEQVMAVPDGKVFRDFPGRRRNARLALFVLPARVLGRRSTGVLNVATGEVHSFRAIAEKVIALSGRRVAIRGTPRTGAMPHNGYRPFDIAACRRAFPDFKYTTLDEGLARAQNEMKEVA